MASSSGRRGLHGPLCWLLSIAAGLLVGALVSRVAPARFDAGVHASAEPTEAIVVQIEPTGERFERTPAGELVPWGQRSQSGSDAGDPATSVGALGSVALADAEPREGSDDDHEAPPSVPAHAPSDPDSASADGHGAGHDHRPLIPLWLCVPFAALLLSIAVMPFISAPFWHRHYPDIALGLGAAVAAYYVSAFGGFGRHEIMHVAVEYYSFIALVGGLFVASGGILVNVKAVGCARTNVALLATGAVIANIVGTTGASMLLIRPYMRINRGRLRPMHIVFFIFIVSNCGGCLSPIGDPPLYLGFLKGVPFFWTLANLWPMWLTVNGVLLAMFYVYDARVPASRIGRIEAALAEGVSHDHGLIMGRRSMAFLIAIVACVFVDGFLKDRLGYSGAFPVGATLQILLAAGAYTMGSPYIRSANGFNFEPVKEVGFLFVGIFLTMAPALGYLAVNSSKLGLETPGQFYFGTGALSGVLDNAPTYVSFLQASMGVLHLPLTPAGIETLIRCGFDLIEPDGMIRSFNGRALLTAISLGAVFFGAMTYIGNGPNFMVRAIVDSAGDGTGVRMPSFFGYAGYSVVFLLPVLVLAWAVFIRV